MNNIATNRFQIINGRTFLDGKLVTVTSEPLKPANMDTLNLTISSRGTAVNLVRALEKTWKDQRFAIQPHGDEWQVINSKLLSPADLAWLDEARGLPEYYEVI